MLRVASLRREKVVESCLYPNRKPKHSRQNLQDLVNRAETDYVDFQEARAFNSL